jgi:putative transposase
MVAHPGDYRWSSYRANAQGEADVLLTPHALYLSLASDEAKRRKAYRELFRHELDPGSVDAIRAAANGNFALGDARFAADIAAALGRRASPGVAGRPRRLPQVKSGDLFEWKP